MATTLTHQQLLQALLAAAYSKEILRIDYYTPSGAEPVTREVEPYSIIDIDGATMLKAYQLAPEGV
jgi:predicted DNA-binding transcriptional regulator YafY